VATFKLRQLKKIKEEDLKKVLSKQRPMCRDRLCRSHTLANVLLTFALTIMMMLH